MPFDDLADKAEPPAGDGPDHVLVPAAVTDRRPCPIDVATQRQLRDDPSIPDGIQQIVPADDLVAVPDEMHEEIEDLWAYRDGFALSGQLPPISVEDECSEQVPYRFAPPLSGAGPGAQWTVHSTVKVAFHLRRARNWTKMQENLKRF